MKRSTDNHLFCVFPGFAVLVTAVLGFGVAGAQDSAPVDTAAEVPALESDTAATPQQEPEDDQLEEIVLRSQTIFDEDVYVEDVDANILDPDTEAESDEDRLRRLFVIYMDAVSDREFDEADGLAKQIVELTIEIHGLDSSESAKALTNLAIAQHGIEDYESSILNYNAAIGIIERIEDRLSSGLINPLRGLGAAQLASSRPDLARASFDRAVHISHVNSGPHNLDQVETLHSLAETYLAVGEFDDAVDVQKRIYYLQARNIDKNSINIIPALRTRASWQHRMQLYEQERYTLRRIISVTEDNKGKDSLDLIEPLTELGNSFLFVGYSDAAYAQPVSVTSGEIYLKRAVRIAEKNPDSDWRVVADAMLELGDYYVLSDRPNRGHRVYREVWSQLADDEQKLEARAEKLEQLVLLHDIDPPSMYGGDSSGPVDSDLPGFDTGKAVYQYTVSTRGSSTNIRLVDADPPGLDDMYQAVGREMRRLIHRPRLQDGVVVQTDNVVYSHSFLYRQADLPNRPADDVEPVEEPSVAETQ